MGGIVILGATSAIARAIAIEYARRGHALVLAARDVVENEAIAADLRVRYDVPAHALTWDAVDYDAHVPFVGKCAELLGEIEGVVLCNGYMDDQQVAQREWDAACRTIDATFTGSVSVLEKFAAFLEKRRSGWIAALSSVAGDRGRQSNYIYGSAKAGLSTYLQGLRNRLHHAGVHVCTVKPGFVDTKMTFGQVPFAASPESAAKAIVRAIDRRKNVVYVPWFWRYIMLIIRSIPEWQFKRMKM
ncbi:MAG: SDR family oxidoreductase [Candidatus Hydrogenedentota bacterium]